MSNDPTATLPVYASTDQEFSVEEVSALQQAEQAAIGFSGRIGVEGSYFLGEGIGLGHRI